MLPLLLQSCSENKVQDKKGLLLEKKYVKKIEEVEISLIKRNVFEKQIISNGKLFPFRKNNLRFNSSGRVSKIHVKNGDLVKKGERLASLDLYELTTNCVSAENQLKKAEIDFKDGLIGQGIDLKSSNYISDTILNNVKVRTGILRAQLELSKAKHNLDEAVLLAPFTGVIANLNLYEGNHISNTKNFCDIIDDRAFEIQFPIMESELSLIKPKQKVTVIPYANPEETIEGEVTAINPYVNEHGSAQGYALIKNKNKTLFQGMNVKLYVNISIPNEITIPKKAVIIRSQRKVVFTYENKEAKWNYVETGLENATDIVILKGIKESDTIITVGNTHLADGTSVKIK
jgi:RND family efflux transporter MFP subunit